MTTLVQASWVDEDHAVAFSEPTTVGVALVDNLRMSSSAQRWWGYALQAGVVGSNPTAPTFAISTSTNPMCHLRSAQSNATRFF
jgi:hypothetical protein